jgi:cytochrome c-type biogenesis protein CcmH/NrfG
MPELIMIVVVLILLAIPVGIVIALVWYFSSRSKPHPMAQAPQNPKSTQQRLAEIESLRSQNLLTEAEYEEKRRHILDEI